MSILASGVNAHVNPCIICRNVVTACDYLASFASAEVMSFNLGKNGTSIQYPFPDYNYASAMFIRQIFQTAKITTVDVNDYIPPEWVRFRTCQVAS